jgi:hypothetical protein
MTAIMEMSEIDQLLNADEANVRTMRQFFADVSRELPKLLNEAAVLYEICCRAFGQGVSEHARALLPDKKQLYPKAVRGLLLAQIGTLYTMAVADFLRMWVTAPLANVRLQCESLALIKLMEQNLAVAQEWQAIQVDEEGRRFFKKYKKGVKAILQSYNLASAYDRASGVALHSRFIGLARAFRYHERQESYRSTQTHSILAQEFDAKSPQFFLAEVLFVLRVQAHIFAHIQDALPEIIDPILLEPRIPQFCKKVARFDESLRKWLSGLLAQGEQTKE